jgi:hypothetical protein
MHGFRFSVHLATCLMISILPAMASAADGPCSVKNRGAAVVVMVCPAKLPPEALRAAGIQGCKGRKVCNAWIWDDAAKAPAKSVDTDQDLPKSATGSARAVWISEGEQLMELQRAR